MANITGIFRIGRDAELRYTQGGDPVASLALVLNYGKKADKTSQWIDASIWGKRAESLAPYLLKGQQIYAVIDDPHIQTFAKRDGGDGFKLAGRISAIEFAGSRPESAQQPQAAPQPPPSRPAANLADMDDDVPF